MVCRAPNSAPSFFGGESAKGRHMNSTTDWATQLTAWLGAIDSFVWGPAMLVLLLGTGLYLTLGMGLMPMRQSQRLSAF